jgi:hypothetical protein
VPPTPWAALQPFVQSAKPTRYAGEPRCARRLCSPPIVENSGLAGFRPRPRWQIIEFLINRAGKEPQIVFRCSVDLYGSSQRFVKIIM